MCGNFYEYDDNNAYYYGIDPAVQCDGNNYYACLDPIDVTDAVRKGAVEISIHANEPVQAICEYAGFTDIAGIVQATLEMVVVSL